MKTGKLRAESVRVALLFIIVVSFASLSFVPNVKSSPSSAYYYRFTVDREGFTNVVINFNSTDMQGNSWVFVPKSSNWTKSVTSGQILNPKVVDTSQVTNRSQYFYQAFQFGYQSNGFFNMTIKYGFKDGALIIEPRGIFYSPLIGFEPHSSGTAELFLYSGFTVSPNPDEVLVVGSNDYHARQAQLNHALFNLSENIVRLQVEFSVNATPQYFSLPDDKNTFNFTTLIRYEAYANEVLKFYDRAYGNFTRLFSIFNVTSDGPIAVQWFLPDFQNLLTVGGYVPVFTGGLGAININVAFIRAVNGTLEVIAAHELVHRFIGKAGISPDDFLWFHEGMAQYISVNYVLSLGYEGAKQERDDLESSADNFTLDTDFSQIGLQNWSPSYTPYDEGTLYVAAYYVVSRLPQVVKRSGFDYYGRFFKLIPNATINNLSIMALYLSEAANASVALTLQHWGFTLADLYKSPELPLFQEATTAVDGVNPVFQPYKALAQYYYQQGLQSAEQGDWKTAQSLWQTAITLANLAPFFTFLTILVILALLVFILSRREPKPKPVVPQPPEWIMQPPTS